MGIPQHFLQDDVLAGYDAMREAARRARRRHRRPHPRERRAAGDAARGLGRPQAPGHGVPRRPEPGRAAAGREHHPQRDLLELCFMLLDHAKIMPYYFYMCDMIPNAEHWRLSVWRGAGPAVRDPRVPARVRDARAFVCDVPFVGKRWVHMLKDYDRDEGHLVLDEELPDRDRVRRPRGALTRVPLLRPDLHAPRGGPGVLARAGRGRPTRCRLGGAHGGLSSGRRQDDGQGSRGGSTSGSSRGSCVKSNAPRSGFACASRSVSGLSSCRSSMNFSTDENS